MFEVLRKIVSSKPPVAAPLRTAIDPYLPRLYLESRQILFRILLGE